jgi:choloylglycine hydrolase
MKTFCLLLAGILLFCSLAPAQGSACTTFVLGEKNHQVFGRNYDWDVEDALVIVNKRGMAKSGYPNPDEKGTPARWVSKYGSVTFNQYGRELPTGGMNEAGLVVETMALSEARYPRPDDRPYLGSALQWRQFLLDNYARVSEVIASDALVRISPRRNGLGIHVLISDRSGDCASIEFLDGEMVAHSGSQLPVRVLTNDTYASSIYHWQNGKTPVLDPGRSIERFMKAAAMLEKYDPQKATGPTEYAFKILDAVSARRTVWRIVYENVNMKIFFLTRANPEIRIIDVTRLDFACQTPVQVIDINTPLSGDITDRFEDYTRQKNRTLIENSFRKTRFLRNYTDAAFDRLADFPDSMTCKP